MKEQRESRSSANSTPRYRAFRKKLRQARLDAGLTQREVAAKLGRLQSYIVKCEDGTRRVDAAELFEFAAVYGKPVDYFDPGRERAR